MKIRITETEIEANAQELRESNTLSGKIANLLRGIFQSTEPCDDGECEEGRDEDEHPD